MSALKAAGLGVEDIDFVMCTHLHGDHVGWNTRLENGRWVPTFPKARYLFSKKEYTYWSEVHQKTPLDNISESVLPVIEANRAELVTSDHELNDHIRLTPTPGHTPDHFAVCAGRRGDQAVFTGDLIHSPIQARYPELVMRVDTDRDQAVATRRRFLDRKSTRLNSSHLVISYAVFCLKKKKKLIKEFFFLNKNKNYNENNYT